MNRSISYFVSPHGFGHATRASAVIRALQDRDPALEVQVITTVPRRLFDQSVPRSVDYLEYRTDIGLVQSTPVREDLTATLHLLDEMLPFDQLQVRRLAQSLIDRHCDLVICDIAPLGIAVAREAALPSLLVENFTWDWIYAEYADEAPRILDHVEYLEMLFGAADYHVRAEPAHADRPCDCIVSPIYRTARLSPKEVREMLGVPDGAKVLLATFGGTAIDWNPADTEAGCPDVFFVVPSRCDRVQKVGNVIKVPVLGELYHPDLVSAADATITKLGYSTVVEAAGAGVPVGYIRRPRFRESQVLERFLLENVHAADLMYESLASDAWYPVACELLNRTKTNPRFRNGASEVAAYVYESVLR